jgi:hypothetical protein
MKGRVHHLLLIIAVAVSGGARVAGASEPCGTESGRACAPAVARSEVGPGVVRLVAPLAVAPSPNPRQSLLAVIPGPPRHTLGARLWDLVQRGIQIDGTVSPDIDDRPPLPGGRGFQLVMVGVKVRFGEELATELWGEIVGIEVLDHSVSFDGTFRPF